MLAPHPGVEVVGEAKDGIDGLDQIASLHPDLIFLDVQMPKLNGFQMLKAIPVGSPIPLVIFVTGYDEYALAAFEAEALAYLLKPIEEERLASSLNRARQLSKYPSNVREEQHRVVDMARRAATRMDYIVGRRQDRFVLLHPTEIAFFMAESGVVKAHTVTDIFHVDINLNELEKSLFSQRYFRAHRSTLVNLAHVREIEPYFRSSYMLVMMDAGKSEIQVSERQAKLLRERIPGL
jgi:DNA-binding LytR/AlgR family response regulator